MDFKNYMEDVVEQKMDEVLARYPKCCTCDSCKLDIAVLALNNLKPRYITTEAGHLYTRIEEFTVQAEIEVIQQIAAAAQKVMAHPRHAKVESGTKVEAGVTEESKAAEGAPPQESAGA